MHIHHARELLYNREREGDHTLWGPFGEIAAVLHQSHFQNIIMWI